MRDFAYINSNFIEPVCATSIPEDNPCYQPSVYDSVSLEECQDSNGNKYFSRLGTVRILLHAEKYRRLLGDDNINQLMKEMHPTSATLQDGLTDDQRMEMIVSRHCQSLSERQSLMSALSERMRQLKLDLEFEKQAEQQAEPAIASATASTE
ncbi:hypothetical protein [Microvirus mar56]|uniref:Internal scaffolding protein n=1 Tax=Microvirus mar56 TaxID=2851192 RepID=A0A8F5MJU6_9VIRU|nr:hypothetical protein [Microvirus mar56]